MMKVIKVKMAGPLIGAKILAVVVPSRMAEIAWIMLKVVEERGLIKMSQIAYPVMSMIWTGRKVEPAA